jgi:Uma2 family endonuclease
MATIPQNLMPSPDQGPSRRLLTAADLAALPSELPSGTVLYELDYGRLVTMPPPGDIHSAADGKVYYHLYAQGESRGLGKARTEVGIVLARNPDRIVGADAAFIANASLPIRRSAEGYLETIPELVVEVRSKNDTLPEVQRKVEEYLAAGVRVAWVADPDARTITAHRRGQEPQVFTETDTLTIEDVIPGFKLLVADVFKE